MRNGAFGKSIASLQGTRVPKPLLTKEMENEEANRYADPDGINRYELGHSSPGLWWWRRSVGKTDKSQYGIRGAVSSPYFVSARRV